MTTTIRSAEEYREALKAVIDPEIYQNIVDLGLVYGVAVAEADSADAIPGDAVTVTMTLTTPHCPMGPQIMQDVEHVLRTKGAATVTIDLVWQPPWTPEAMTDDLKRELGLDAQDEEPVLMIDPTPPSPPKKKGWLSRLFGW
ncbi:MAG TPA: metal-sulfur cluster assembly factor [Caldilineaceae bacterium]|nr:metal-sulfur cluster assembly factor [Caldilineaceae bacterium]HRW03640.1 metal-sulfur cluster assembly factor [Caldilineaceae bacterium]